MLTKKNFQVTKILNYILKSHFILLSVYFFWLSTILEDENEIFFIRKSF